MNDETCENMGEIYTVTFENGQVNTNRVTSNYLEPGVAYLVTNNNSNNLTIPNAAIFNIDKTTSVTEPVTTNYLQGTFEDIYATVGSYVMNPDGEWHIVDKENTIQVDAYKAYVQTSLH